MMVSSILALNVWCYRDRKVRDDFFQD